MERGGMRRRAALQALGMLAGAATMPPSYLRATYSRPAPPIRLPVPAVLFGYATSPTVLRALSEAIAVDIENSAATAGGHLDHRRKVAGAVERPAKQQARDRLGSG